MVYPLIMVIYGDGKELLRPVLPYHILIKELMYLLRLVKGLYLAQRLSGRRVPVIVPHIVSGQLDTVRTNARIHALKQKGYFLLASSAKHAMPILLIRFRHIVPYFFLVRISSIMPYSRASAEVIQKSRSPSA